VSEVGSGSSPSRHQELGWDFEQAGYGDVEFAYGEIETMSFRAQAALTQGVYCNEIEATVSGYGWHTNIATGKTAKIIVGNPAVTRCTGGLLSVTKIRVYLETEAGNSPSYRYGLQANSGGNPSGTWLGATHQGYGDLTATTTGWQTITLNESVTLTAGTVYHIVVQPQGTPSSSNYIALRQSAPQNGMLPYDGASDPNSNTLWYNGSSWSTQGSQPIYLLETATPTYEGNPSETTTNQSVYGANYSGERFTISGGNQQVTGIGFYVRKSSSTNPADNLYYQIRDSTDTVVRSGTLVSRTAITTSYSWYDVSLSSALTMTDGGTYRVDLYSTGSSSSYYYQVSRNDNTDNAAYNGRNYYGTGSVYCSSANSGSSWTPSNQCDIPFRLTTIPDISITQYNISTVGNIGIVLSY